ncbi:hypothetical protein CROQUDRAFT_574284 [Cronartium quercuum f. sp. fusiforme G11]|uniref:Uncharacterized protein n=1 Tax=Cronartium quercuum f. sp. fusiforme G11 TaxID=708437 RepID=A0A9P6TGQ9_9BASI|nr:hypothetical protein CROQUDRAFT_574284 [Cronartium quercuum f. sp. fusiforme G11]
MTRVAVSDSACTAGVVHTTLLDKLFPQEPSLRLSHTGRSRVLEGVVHSIWTICLSLSLFFLPFLSFSLCTPLLMYINSALVRVSWLDVKFSLGLYKKKKRKKNCRLPRNTSEVEKLLTHVL